MEIKDTARGRIEVQLRAWGAEIDKLRAKVDQEIAEAKKEYYEQVERLRGEIEEQVKKWSSEIALRDLRAKIEAELRAWGPEIETLKGRAARAEIEAKRMIEELKAKRKELKARVDKLRHAGEGAWEDVKGGIGKAWEELRPALQSAIAKFK
jgi:predicted  nucleic acid-binding Zn-ribbon protein